MVTKRKTAKAAAQWEHDTRRWAIETARTLALDLYHHQPSAIRPYDIGVILAAGETIWAQVPVAFNHDASNYPTPPGPHVPTPAIRPWLVTSHRLVSRLGDDLLHGYAWQDMVGVRVELAAGREALAINVVGQPTLVWFGAGLAPMAVAAVFHLYGPAALIDHPGLESIRNGQDWGTSTSPTAPQRNALPR
jgi:hypothetical protein